MNDDMRGIGAEMARVLRLMLDEAGMTQKDLAADVPSYRHKGETVHPSTISRWLSGEVGDVKLSQIIAVDQAVGRPAGTWLEKAGIVSRTVDTKTAVMSDPRLTEKNRKLLLALYDSLREPARTRPRPRSRPGPNGGAGSPRGVG